jgi:hypothetical protein
VHAPVLHARQPRGQGAADGEPAAAECHAVGEDA